MGFRSWLLVGAIAGWCQLAGGANATTFAPDELNRSGAIGSAGYTLLSNKWGTPGLGNPGGTVTYSLMDTGTSCGREFIGCQTVSFADMFRSLPGWQTELSNAFNMWSSAADISFVEVADNGISYDGFGAVGDIRLGGHAFDGPGNALAHAYGPPPNGRSAAGDVHLDSEEIWKLGFGGAGFNILWVLTHEIGHSIGLGHSTLPTSLMYSFYSETTRSLQADDIAAVQEIYGAAQPGVATVPLPAGLTLTFGSLGALALIGIRRKRPEA